MLKNTYFLTFLNHLDFFGKMWYDAFKKRCPMYETQVSYFKSEYDKNIVLYGKQTIYEPLPISEDKLLNEIKWQTGLIS